MRVAFYTLGCKLNQSESEALASSFKSQGFFITSSRQKAEIYIVNTCTVTSKAEQKARRMIRKFAREHPDGVVVVTGCYAQLEREEIAALAENVLPVGHENKADLLDLAECLRAAPGFSAVMGTEKGRNGAAADTAVLKETVRECIGELLTRGKGEGGIFRFDADTYSFHSRAFLKIQDGCDYGCTYCRVPLARGGSVSIDAATAAARAVELEASGYGEVVLTGVNITSYRDPEHPRTGLPELIERILEETVRLRLRLSSLEPEMITRRLLDVLADSRVQPHFHIPVQSGSDRVLAAVRRPYKAERVSRAVSDLRAVKADPFIAADIIAGLPGESEEDFHASYSLLRECRFSALHVFPFSPRPGTKAENADGRVPERVIGERADALRKLAGELQHEYIERWLGREVEAVLEKRQDDSGEVPGEENAGECWSALSANYLHLMVYGLPSGEGRSGELCRVSVELEQEPGDDRGEMRDGTLSSYLLARYLSRAID